MSRVTALLLCTALLAPACATAGAPRLPRPDYEERTVVDRELWVHYVRQLPIGSRVRVAMVRGETLRGTLMKVVDEGIVIQPRTRIPEPPREVPFDRIRAVELDVPNGAGRAVAIGAAVGAGAALGLLLVLAALFAGD